MAKSEKKAAGRQGAGAKSSGAEPPPGKDEAGSKNTLFIIGAVVAAVLVGGLAYWKATTKRQCGRPRRRRPIPISPS